MWFLNAKTNETSFSPSSLSPITQRRTFFIRSNTKKIVLIFKGAQHVLPNNAQCATYNDRTLSYGKINVVRIYHIYACQGLNRILSRRCKQYTPTQNIEIQFNLSFYLQLLIMP